MAEGRFVLGIDVGGTFTDFVLSDREAGEVVVEKASSTPADPSHGVIAGLELIAARLGIEVGRLLGESELIVHGTTVTTNAVLTRSGAPTGVITTAGLRDTLAIRRGVRDRRHLYDNKYEQPRPLVSRELRLGVGGRIDKDGEEVEPLDAAAVRAAAATLAGQGVAAVAIAFMHSYANDAHEREAAAILAREFPDLDVSVSVDVAEQVGLYPRLSTTVLNAYTRPILGGYLGRLDATLRGRGFAGTLLVMQSNGGVAGAAATEALPAATLLSGPAAGPTAGASFSAPHGEESCIVVDMGGTSFDASLAWRGRPTISSEGELDGLMVSLPSVDIHTVGAGGGSIGWVDDGGILHMGPQSAGAVPGPACYGRGGREPTCTDANLLLGYIDPEFFLGGRMALDPEAARAAVRERIGAPLGLDERQAAAGMLAVINVNMASELKEITTQRGHDPRDFPLVVAGGAGPLHGAAIARELGIERVIVPAQSSVLCALGMLTTDLKHDYVASCPSRLDEVDVERVAGLFGELGGRGAATLAAEGIGAAETRLEYAADLRYLGQHHEITVPVPFADLESGRFREAAAAAFDRRHGELYGFNWAGAPIELLVLRVAALGRRPGELPAPAAVPGSEAVPKGSRPMYVESSGGFEEIPVYAEAELGPGASFPGPAVIESATTTILVPADFELSRDELGSFVLDRRTAPGAVAAARRAEGVGR